MTDLATLGLRVQSEEVEVGDRRLDSLEQSARSAEAATDGLAAAARGLGASLLPTLSSIDASVRELLELQRAQQGVATVSAAVASAANSAGVAVDNLAADLQQASTAGMFFGASFRTVQDSMGGAAAEARNWGAAVAQADDHLVAYKAHLDQLAKTMPQVDDHMAAYRRNLDKIGDAMPPVRRQLNLTAQDSLNLTRQLADIGVTGAMGMNPMMIALQQGPQLFDIMQVAAIRSGMTIRQAMVATGAAVWTALAPLIPILAAIAAAGAITFVGFSLGAREAEKELGSIQSRLGLTDAEMKKLKDSGIDTGVTIGDVFRGVGTTIKEGFFDLFKDQIQDIDKAWNDFLDAAWKVYVAGQKIITGATFAAFYAIRDTWKMLPGVLGDAAVSAANATVNAVEWMANKVRDFFNSALRFAQVLSSVNPVFSWARGLQEMGTFDFGQFTNPWAGQARAAGAQAAKSAAEGWNDAAAFIDRQNARLLENIGASQAARARRGLGDRSDSGSGGTPEVAKAVEELQGFEPVRIRPIDVNVPELVDPLKLIADELRLIDDLARDAAEGMASAFGDTGRAMGDLLTVMTSYQSRLAEIDLAEREYRLSAAQADRERASAQAANYGNMAAAARGFFKEGSDGYEALLMIERAYRLQQMLGAIQAMGIGQQETVLAVANSARRAISYGIEAVANAYRSIPYPFNLAAAGATIAGLAALGIKLSGGGGGGSAANDNSVQSSTQAVQSYNTRQQQAEQASAAAIGQAITVKVEASEYFDARVQGVMEPRVINGDRAAAQTGASSAVDYVNANAAAQQRRTRMFKN